MSSTTQKHSIIVGTNKINNEVKAVANGNVNTNHNSNKIDVPPFLDKVTLHEAIRAAVGDYIKIVEFRLANDVKNGEYFSTLRLKIEVDVLLANNKLTTTCFVLKTQPNNEKFVSIIHQLKLLEREEQMYQNFLPKLEQLFQECRKNIKFVSRAFKFDRDVGVDYVLLEDLRKRNFKIASNVLGFDMMHMEHALSRLAEFHAASACYTENHGMFPEQYTVGVFNAANRQLLQEFNATAACLTQMKLWKDCERYYKKLTNIDDHLVDRLLLEHQVISSDFNVLNHGDLWASNIMFQYDAFGKITDTRFTDFQACKYGSPAYDLYYLILSTAALDIKLSQFDYFVRFYYENLIENLQLLQYQRPLPKLKNLHAALLKNGLIAFLVVSKILPIVMFEKTYDNDTDNFKQMNNDTKLKLALYTNPKYVRAMSMILPWLDNRGLLDFP